jgi:hypothetical protein
MAQLLVRNKPTTLICTANPDHEMEWDSDDMLFLIDNDEKIIKELNSFGYYLHPMIPEIIVWGRQLDFKTTYVARKEDFDWID